MTIKVAFIGAGSVGFTRTLVRDILKVPELQDTTFALHDINAHNLDMVAQILEKDIAANGIPAKLAKSVDRKRALEGADYVVNCTRIGGLEAFKTDIEIPLKYGVDQCVGDTICAGGIMYAARNIPQVLAFCKDMREVSASDVLFLNYANPMAMNTWAALDHGGIDTVGLCHGVQGGHAVIDITLAAFHGDPYIDWHDYAGREERTQVVCAGINHQTWYVDIRYKGRKVESDELLAAFEKNAGYMKSEKVRIDVLRRFGCFSTESNGHLSEYLPWYRKRPGEINQWVDLSSWINGETGGYLRVCAEGRNWFESDYPKWLAEAGKPLSEYKRSNEHGSWIIESRETGRVYRGHFNRRNNGTIKNLPDDCIIEAPGWVDRFGINMMSGIELPMACAATCNVSVQVQRMAKDAAVRGDVTLLKQAVLHDPLVGAVCNPEEVWQMVDEMLVAQAPWLPQFASAVEGAKSRLAAHERGGTRVALRDWQGAARLETRSVDQLRAKKEGSVLEADKAAAKRAEMATAK